MLRRPISRHIRAFLLAAGLLACAACGDDNAANSTTVADGPGDSDAGDDREPEAAEAAAACSYESPFTGDPECREYVGDAWGDADVESSCSQLRGELDMEGQCPTTDLLGRCALDGDAEQDLVIYAYGAPAACDAQQTGCEVFGGGVWEPEAPCAGSAGGGGGGGGGGGVFIQPTLECEPPLDGEPAGAGPDGQVCTWQSIAGCTEEGRSFADYASCDVVRSQRPYYPVPPAAGSDAADPRMDDPAYVAELDWVESQIRASGCVCCHEQALTPEGASNWYIDAPGNWINTFRPSGLALGATWVNSVALGAYPAEHNNGFDRERSGIPSTDPERMRRFFANELAHRGFAREDFADAPPFGGPLYQQVIFEPTACDGGEGVARGDGAIRWQGGDARYLHVLERGSDNPTVPPNLDLPEGTLWRLDVPATGAPMESGAVRYGDVPAGLVQRVPDAGAPAALVEGREYYLYVVRDVGIPITRCLFTF